MACYSTLRKLAKTHDNYIPMHVVRESLVGTREQVDTCLFELQKLDKVELSTLQEGTQFTPEQASAGIEQLVGGSIFFVTLTELM